MAQADVLECPRNQTIQAVANEIVAAWTLPYGSHADVGTHGKFGLDKEAGARGRANSLKSQARKRRSINA